MMFGVSAALFTIFMNVESMLLNLLVSCGSCLAMSPPLNTASMYCHMFWTVVHCSTISLTVESLLIQLCTSSLNGSEYRLVAMLAKAICESSSFSMMTPRSEDCKITGPLFLYSAKENCMSDHSSEIWLSLISICSSLLAAEAISSISSMCPKTSSLKRLATLRTSSARLKLVPVTLISSCQCLSRMDFPVRSSKMGNSPVKSSTFFLQSE